MIIYEISSKLINIRDYEELSHSIYSYNNVNKDTQIWNIDDSLKILLYLEKNNVENIISYLENYCYDIEYNTQEASKDDLSFFKKVDLKKKIKQKPNINIYNLDKLDEFLSYDLEIGKSLKSNDKRDIKKISEQNKLIKYHDFKDKLKVLSSYYPIKYDISQENFYKSYYKVAFLNLIYQEKINFPSSKNNIQEKRLTYLRNELIKLEQVLLDSFQEEKLPLMDLDNFTIDTHYLISALNSEKNPITSKQNDQLTIIQEKVNQKVSDYLNIEKTEGYSFVSDKHFEMQHVTNSAGECSVRQALIMLDTVSYNKIIKDYKNEILNQVLIHETFHIYNSDTSYLDEYNKNSLNKITDNKEKKLEIKEHYNKIQSNLLEAVTELNTFYLYNDLLYYNNKTNNDMKVAYAEFVISLNIMLSNITEDETEKRKIMKELHLIKNSKKPQFLADLLNSYYIKKGINKHFTKEQALNEFNLLCSKDLSFLRKLSRYPFLKF